MGKIIIEIHEDYDPSKVLLILQEKIKESLEGLNILKEIRIDDD